MMRDTDQCMIRQNPHNKAAVYSVTATLSTIFQGREKPRLVHSSGRPRIAVTKNNKPRMNRGRSSSDGPGRQVAVGGGWLPPGTLAVVVLPQRTQALADGGNSAPHAGQTIVSMSFSSLTLRVAIIGCRSKAFKTERESFSQ